MPLEMPMIWSECGPSISTDNIVSSFFARGWFHTWFVTRSCDVTVVNEFIDQSVIGVGGVNRRALAPSRQPPFFLFLAISSD